MKQFLLTFLLLGLAACSSTTTFDPDAGGLRTVDKANYGDFEQAAGSLIESMLTSGALTEPNLSKHEDGRIILGLEDIDNMTASNLQPKVLTDKVRIALNKTGRVLTTTAVKFGRGGPEDTSTAEVRELGSMAPMFEQNAYANARTVVLPDLSLSGSIIQMSASENRTKETVLIFKLTLTDLRTGLAIWEDEAPVGKRRTKTIFGT
ncbi:MAG: hypothetical protein MK213_00800 [Planctomycetes bacterium]|nr:hypothetical protein [Planctomycetota bacterium]